MKLQRRQFLHLAAGAAALPALSRIASAQAYPSRPITIMVPFGPGSATDTVARIISQPLGIALKQNIVVEAKAGANGTIAATQVARAAPDGYTLMLSTNTPHSAAPSLNKNISYDPVKDFAPLSRIGSYTQMLVIHPAVPATSIAELIAYARANPGKLAYGSGGIGAITHITPELFKQRAGGLDILHVPYRGIAPAMNDLLAGQIGIIFPNITSQVVALHRAGRIRILAVNAPARLEAAPEIPTVGEAGLLDFVSQIFFGIFAPIGTPDPVVEEIDRATQKEWADKPFQKKLVESGFEPMLGFGPERSDRYLEEEFAKWNPIVQRVQGL